TVPPTRTAAAAATLSISNSASPGHHWRSARSAVRRSPASFTRLASSSRAAGSTRRTHVARAATAALPRRTAPKPTPRLIRGRRPSPPRTPAALSPPRRHLLQLIQKVVLKKVPLDDILRRP